MRSSCCSVRDVETAYLILLIVAFLAIGAVCVRVLLKLYAGER
jgi:hypothetical protein